MQVVFGVYRMPLLVPLRRLHIGRTCHDELVNGLQPPALSDKFGGQPIEEILIGWPVPDAAEIIAGFDRGGYSCCGAKYLEWVESRTDA